MSTIADPLDRVVNALEDFASQEELLMRAEDYAGVAAVQERMDPLVAFLVGRMAAANAALRQRIASFVARRDRTAQYLATEVGKIRDELTRLELSRRRVARVAPAYGRQSVPMAASQLSARS
jgi:hypothetical protein